MKILFWNTHKNENINTIISELITDNNISIVVLAEYTADVNELLQILIDNKDKVVTRDEMLENIWGYEYEPETNVIDVYIRYLRAKLNSNDKEKYIQTVRSVGYIMRS